MEENTLEPIQPIEETPLGALIIGNDILCTPTSLCTWSDEKPSVYCQLPQHTLNPVCKEANKGIGLIGCFNEPTCGGLVRKGATDEILDKNPHYKSLIVQEEVRVKKQGGSLSRSTVIGLIVMVVLVVVSSIVAYYSYRRYKKRHPRYTTQIQKRSTSHKISSGVAKTARPVSR